MYNYTSHKHVDISLQNSAFCHRKKTSIVVAPAHHDNAAPQTNNQTQTNHSS
jgi:hypothetical protein